MNEIKTGTSKSSRKLSFNFNGFTPSGLSGKSVSLFLCNKEWCIGISLLDNEWLSVSLTATLKPSRNSEIVLCHLSDTGRTRALQTRSYIKARFIWEAQQQREHFNTAVFKQLRSKMSVFITWQSRAAWSASLRAVKLQLDSGLHHRSERSVTWLVLKLSWTKFTYKIQSNTNFVKFHILVIGKFLIPNLWLYFWMNY